MKIEVGKMYYNVIGELRKIVGTHDDDPYVFIDHMNWTYTADGVYDLIDTAAGADRYDLWQEYLVEDKYSHHANMMCLALETALSDTKCVWSDDKFAEALNSVNQFRDYLRIKKFIPERY